MWWEYTEDLEPMTDEELWDLEVDIMVDQWAEKAGWEI